MYRPVIQSNLLPVTLLGKFAVVTGKVAGVQNAQTDTTPQKQVFSPVNSCRAGKSQTETGLPVTACFTTNIMETVR